MGEEAKNEKQKLNSPVDEDLIRLFKHSKVKALVRDVIGEHHEVVVSQNKRKVKFKNNQTRRAYEAKIADLRMIAIGLDLSEEAESDV